MLLVFSFLRETLDRDSEYSFANTRSVLISDSYFRYWKSLVGEELNLNKDLFHVSKLSDTFIESDRMGVFSSLREKYIFIGSHFLPLFLFLSQVYAYIVSNKNTFEGGLLAIEEELSQFQARTRIHIYYRPRIYTLSSRYTAKTAHVQTTKLIK